MKEEKRVFYLKVEISTLRLTPSTSILKQPIAETRPILKGNKKDPKKWVKSNENGFNLETMLYWLFEWRQKVLEKFL